MNRLIQAFTLLAGILLLGAVMGYLAGFFHEKIPPGRLAPEGAGEQAPTVAVERVLEPLVEQSPGTLRARNEATLSARHAATIVELTARSGDRVEKGEVMVRLDDAEMQARVRQAEEALRSIEARLENALLDQERAREQFSAGVVPKAAQDLADSLVNSLRAESDRAREAIDEAEAALAYATITSPISGRVIDRYAEPGDTAAPGLPLLRLYDPATLRLEADVRESLAMRLKRGDRLSVRIDALDKDLAGVVDEIVPQSDAGSRAFVVKVSLETTETLYPGMFGRLLVPAGEEHRIYAPETAIVRMGQLEWVTVATTEGPVRRFVRTGHVKENGQVEVISGLSGGEQVLVAAP